jgi:hypothetical protein
MDTALTLTTDMELVLGLVVFTMVMFLFERIRADVVALVVLVVLGLTGLVPREDLFGGFSGSAVMSIIATMILGAGLDRTGALNRLAGWLLRRAHGVESRLLLYTTACCRHHQFDHAEPVGDVAVPAGGVAAVVAHRPDPVADAAAAGGGDRDGRRADHGRQFAADPAQRPAGRGQRQPALRRGLAGTAATCSRRCRSASPCWRHRWRISISSAASCCARTAAMRLPRRAPKATSPAPTASTATCTSSP